MPLLTNRVRQYLDGHDIAYTQINHLDDDSVQQTAHDCGLKPGDFAKVVGVHADGRQLLAVLPADHYIDLMRLQQQLGVNHIDVLAKNAMATFFPDCEVGACPPLGNLYGLPVYIAPSLTKHKTISFSAGTHEEAIQMPYSTFKQLVHPTVMDFAVPLDR